MAICIIYVFKETKSGIFLLTKQKNPLNSVSAEILLHKKCRSFSSNAGKRILIAIEVVLTRDC